MSRQGDCPGTLLWFDVAADARFPTPSAIAMCSDCGATFVSGSQLDDRHRDAQVVPVD